MATILNVLRTRLFNQNNLLIAKLVSLQKKVKTEMKWHNYSIDNDITLTNSWNYNLLDHLKSVKKWTTTTRSLIAKACVRSCVGSNKFVR